MAFVTLRVGDRATLKKQHPCGGRDWTVTRTGADIGLECTSCTRRVMLDREELERRLIRLNGETVRRAGAPSVPLAEGGSC